MFPLQITFRKSISKQIASKHPQLILNYLESRFSNLMASNFNRENSKVTFKNDFFNGQSRNHILAMVDGGSIETEQASGVITYRFSTVRTALLIFCLSVFAAFMVKSILPLILFNLVGGGLGLLITWLRLSWFTAKLNEEIEALEVKHT